MLTMPEVGTRVRITEAAHPQQGRDGVVSCLHGVLNCVYVKIPGVQLDPLMPIEGLELVEEPV